MKIALTYFTLLSGVLAGPSPPSGAIVVPKDAKTISEAVRKVQPGKTIFLEAGTYKEQVYIPPNKKDITIIGASSGGQGYSGNRATITFGMAQDKQGNAKNNNKTATLSAWGDGFKLYNVNVVNTRGKGSQALALSAYGDNQGYYGCQFKGFQDTILTEKGHHLFVKSLVQGATDFIFGQHSLAWFEKCDIRVVSADKGFVTASGRDSSSNPSWFVINRSDISVASGHSVKSGAYYLGRPWRAYARVVVQNTKLSNVINSAGWTTWNKGDERTSNVYFGEHANTGSGASSKRVGFAKNLRDAVSMESVLGSYQKWADKTWM